MPKTPDQAVFVPMTTTKTERQLLYPLRMQDVHPSDMECVEPVLAILQLSDTIGYSYMYTHYISKCYTSYIIHMAGRNFRDCQVNYEIT